MNCFDEYRTKDIFGDTISALNCCNERFLTLFESACFRRLSFKKSFLEVLLCTLNFRSQTCTLPASKLQITMYSVGKEALVIAE